MNQARASRRPGLGQRKGVLTYFATCFVSTSALVMLLPNLWLESRRSARVAAIAEFVLV